MKDSSRSDSFVRVPKILFTDPFYKSLSAESKLMYGLLLDRESLSRKNGWLDESGRVFIYYTVDEMAKDLGFGRDKTMALFKHLEEKKLIKCHRKGAYLPRRITLSDVGKTDLTKSEKATLHGREKRLCDVGKTDSNNTDINNTEMSYTYSSSCEVSEEEIREQIEYDCLCGIYDKASVDGIVCLICDTLSVESERIRIGEYTYSASAVRKRLRTLNSEHIGYALEVMSQTDHELVNVSKYLLSVLFNAPSSMEHYFENKMNQSRS